MVKICQTRLLTLNFEIIPKKRIFRFLPKISAGHAWSWKIFFANFQILGPLGCQGWVVIPQNVKKKSKSLHPNKQLTIVKPMQTGINRNNYTFCILKSLEPLKKFKNQPRPLVRPSSINFCQKFWNLSHETVPLSVARIIILVWQFFLSNVPFQSSYGAQGDG